MEPVTERPTKLVVDCITGKVETLFLTDEEIRQSKEDQIKMSQLTPSEEELEESLWEQ